MKTITLLLLSTLVSLAPLGILNSSLLKALANPHQNRIRLLEQQIEILQQQQNTLVPRNQVERRQRASAPWVEPLPPEWNRIQIQILGLQADIETERLREEDYQRQQEDRHRQQAERQQQAAQQQAIEQQRQQTQQQRNIQAILNLEDLLILQQEELTRLKAEYNQAQALYPLGILSESQWNAIQRRLNVQRERIQRTQGRLLNL